MNRVSLLFFSAWLHCISVSGQELSLPQPENSITHHEGIFNEKIIRYTAIAEETFLYNKNEKSPDASVMSFSYMADNTSANDNRPVIFIFNGGPGASSSPLHLHAYGPYIFPAEGGKTLEVNTNSLLDVADLVFIDPVGTGFTRVFNERDGSSYWDVREDAISILHVVKTWRQKYDRQSAPLFLCGESYGTMRLAEMMGINEDIPVSGIIMLSSILDLTSSTAIQGNDFPYIAALPGYAAIAWFHGKSKVKAENASEMFEKASLFAERRYFSALAKGYNLKEAEKQSIALELAALIGLDVDTILSRDLRIKPEDFQLLLLAGRDERIGLLDGRKTGPLHTDLKPPFSDPSMGMKKDTVSARLMKQYFSETLNYRDTGKYRTLNMNVNSKWIWTSALNDFYYTVMPELSKAALKFPKMKIFVAGGIFDLATPVYASKYQFAHLGIPAGRVDFETFPTGHSIFEDREQLKILGQKIREFIGK